MLSKRRQGPHNKHRINYPYPNVKRKLSPSPFPLPKYQQINNRQTRYMMFPDLISKSKINNK